MSGVARRVLKTLWKQISNFEEEKNLIFWAYINPKGTHGLPQKVVHGY